MVKLLLHILFLPTKREEESYELIQVEPARRPGTTLRYLIAAAYTKNIYSIDLPAEMVQGETLIEESANDDNEFQVYPNRLKVLQRFI